MKPLNKLQVYRLALACLAVVLAPIAMAQTSSVELLGTVTAAQATNGLGFNLDEGSEWQWAAAAAAGATYARIQCSWNIVEKQTAPPNNTAASPQYVQDPNCTQAFGYAAKYGISPIVVAAYGAPYHKILGVTVPAGAAVGATSFTIEFEEGEGGDTLANLAVPYDYICPASTSPQVQVPAVVCSSAMTGSHSPEGSLIQSVTQVDSTHATISLASALTTALPAGEGLYNISEILYPSTATELATDPSIIAYGNFVSFLASDLAAHGLKGQIEIWNEPPSVFDPWDNRCLLYDDGPSAPCPSLPGSAPGRNEPNFGFVANLQQRTMPAGVTLTWNGTSGSGWASILGPRMRAESGAVAAQPATVVTEESFHPYGFEPEEMMWSTQCLENTVLAATKSGQSLNNCYLQGEPTTSNYAWPVQADMIAKAANPAFGVGHEITETGYLAPVAGLEMQQARFIMRQFIGFQADGITPVNFFKLYDSGALTDPNFSFVEQAGSTSSYTTKPDYNAISGFMADIKPISSAPVTAYSSQTLPQVVSYTGTYPLSTVHMVGARSGAASNSDAFLVWQRSFVNCTAANVCGVWGTMASPSAAPVSISIPATMKVTQVVNATTRNVVPYTTSQNNISFLVADDPIEVLVDPISSTATSGILKNTKMTLATSNASSTFGQPVVLTATLTPYNSSSSSTDGESVVFMSGTTPLGTGTLASGVATLATASIPAAASTIIVQFAGDTHFGASTGFTTMTVAKADPGLTIPAIAPLTYGAASFNVTPTTNSSGAISLTVVSGPAHIAVGTSTGGTVTILGAGTVVLGATQVPATNYNAGAMVTTSFVVNAADPGLTFQAVAAKTYGYAPFPISAKSLSHGAVSYSVISGPATVSGSTLTLTGAGPVVLEADQQANGNYTAATTTFTFTVAQAIATLSLPSIPAQTFGAAPFPVSATSVSTGTITYSIVSGPATISGNLISITGAGTVVVGANQAASTNYAATALVTTSFMVNGAKPVLAFESFAAKTYGDAPFPVTAKSASHGMVVLSIVRGPATVSGQMVTITGAGTIVVLASQPALGNYVAGTATLSFTVAQQNPNLSLAPIPSHTYGDTPIAVVPTTNSTGAVKVSVVSGPAYTTAGNSNGATVVLTGIGTVVVGASQVPSANYSAATMVTTSFTVSAADPGLTFQAVPAKTYGAGPFTVQAKSASHGAVTYSVLSGPATISGSTVTLTGAGTVVLQASQQANGSYLAVTTTTSFTVSQTTATLSIGAIPNLVYGAAPITINAISPSTGAVTYAVVSGPAKVKGSTMSITGAGTVVLRAVQAESAQYKAPSPVEKSIVVAPQAATMHFDAIASPVYGAKPFTVEAASNSPSPILYKVLAGPATISGQVVTTTGAGSVVLEATQPSSDNYKAGSTRVTLTVQPATPTLAFQAVPSQSLGAKPFRVAASSPSAGHISFAVVSGPATISGNTVTLSGSGRVVLEASQTAEGNYAASPQVETAFTVTN